MKILTESPLITLYLKKAALTHYWGLNEETKRDVNALNESLTNKFHTPEKQYILRVASFSIRQTDSLDEYIEKLDNLFNQLNRPIANRLHNFNLGLKSNLKQALPIQQPNTYAEAVAIARRKNRFSTGIEGKLVEVLKELKHHQLLTPKEENITAPVTSHHPVNLHKKLLEWSKS